MTGTSHEFIIDAWGKYQEKGTLEGTPFFTLVKALASSGNAFRIWWADNSPDAFTAVAECDDSFEGLIGTINKQIHRAGFMAVRFKSGKASRASGDNG